MQYLTIKQTADALAVDHKTVRRMLPRLGAVDIAEPGAKRRTIRIPVEALERFLQGCAIRPPAPAVLGKPTTVKFERRR